MDLLPNGRVLIKLLDARIKPPADVTDFEGTQLRLRV